MDRSTEIELLEELADLRGACAFYLDDAVTTSPVARYTCPERFSRERQALFRALPAIVAHSSELAGSDSFLTRDFAGLPLLLTRDSEGAVHAFLNVCRHRGTRLVDAANGCRRRFVCPYHAWTWDNRGALKGIPHEAVGFPGIDKGALGLKRLGCAKGPTRSRQARTGSARWRASRSRRRTGGSRSRRSTLRAAAGRPGPRS